MIIINSKKFLSLLLATSLCCISIKATTASASDTTANRLSGSSRYETCMEISKYGWTSSDYVVIATGANYPDALCAAPLAKSKNAPIILTEKDKLNATTLAELQRLKVKEAFLIGGTGVLSDNIITQLTAANIKSTRLAGASRCETSIKIAEYLGTENGISVATGENFPDALSFAPIAAKKGIPILLSSKDTLSSGISNFIKGKNVPVSYVIGGSGVLSDNVLSSLPNSKRLFGINRYETNINVIKEFEKELDFNSVFLATGKNFPDALSGSALAPKFNAPIVLTDSTLPEITKSYIRTKAISQVHILGGTGVISAETEADFLLLPKDTNPLFQIEVGGKCGFIDRTGKTIIEPKYYFCNSFTEGLAVFYTPKAQTLTSASIIKPMDDTSSILCGIIDKTGKEILPPTYNYIGSFNDGIALAHNVVNNVKQWCILNRQGQVVARLNGNILIDNFNEGMITLMSGSFPNAKYGLIDKTGKQIVAPTYDYIGRFLNGLAPAAINKKWGYIDKTGAVVIPLKYDSASELYGNYGIVDLNGKSGAIDRYGREIVPIKYDAAVYAEEDMFKVLSNGLWGVVNKYGVEVISPKYTAIRDFSNGVVPVTKDSNLQFAKWGLVDNTGKEITDFTYDYISSAFNGLFVVRTGAEFSGLYGYIDGTGKIVIPQIYNYAGEFFDGLAYVKLNGKCMYINKSGTIVWQPTN